LFERTSNKPNKLNIMTTLETLEATLQKAHDELLAITKAEVFGKPRLQACGHVIEAMNAILAYKTAKLKAKA
jgi:hypothetical protein